MPFLTISSMKSNRSKLANRIKTLVLVQPVRKVHVHIIDAETLSAASSRNCFHILVLFDQPYRQLRRQRHALAIAVLQRFADKTFAFAVVIRVCGINVGYATVDQMANQLESIAGRSIGYDLLRSVVGIRIQPMPSVLTLPVCRRKIRRYFIVDFPPYMSSKIVSLSGDCFGASGSVD